MQLLRPNWPAPSLVKAYISTNTGGISLAPYANFNLATHVGDDLSRVEFNRDLLQTHLHLSTRPHWLNQVHGNDVACFPEAPLLCADAAVTRKPNEVLAILTADCLPILICHESGEEVAAIHAGWRGLANGIISNTFTKLSYPACGYFVYLGPAISQMAYEVGEEVFNTFKGLDPQNSRAFLPSHKPNYYFADLNQLARLQLRNLGVEYIYGGELCSFNDARFYSHRREKTTGRMASLIWFTP